MKDHSAPKPFDITKVADEQFNSSLNYTLDKPAGDTSYDKWERSFNQSTKEMPQLEVTKVSDKTQSLNFSLTKVQLDKTENKSLSRSNLGFGWVTGSEGLQGSLDYSMTKKP